MATLPVAQPLRPYNLGAHGQAAPSALGDADTVQPDHRRRAEWCGLLRLPPRRRALLHHNDTSESRATSPHSFWTSFGGIRKPHTSRTTSPTPRRSARREPGTREHLGESPLHRPRHAVLGVFSGAALALTAVAILVDGQAQSNVPWLATLAFVLAWASAYAGIFKVEDDWRRGACIKPARWWAIIFVPVAVANLFFAATSPPATRLRSTPRSPSRSRFGYRLRHTTTVHKARSDMIEAIERHR